MHLGVPPDDVIFYDNAETTLATGGLTASGALYIGGVAGTTARLNFVFRTDVTEGGTSGGSLVLDNGRVYGLVPGDIDLDGDVDLADFAVLQGCFVSGGLPDQCLPFDFDESGTIVLPDYSTFQGAVSGPGELPVP